MEIEFSAKAKKDLAFWKESGNKAIIKKIDLLFEDIAKNPFSGIGKPEVLKYELSGKWSRKIDSKHRLVYEINEKEKVVYIHSLKGHYEKK